MFGQGFGPYVARMIAALMRLLALVLMPLGTTGAAAAASSMPSSHAMAAANHCDEQGNQDQAPVSKMGCTAMCTALPATGEPVPAPALKPMAPRTVTAAMPFYGIEPEIATPPPRLV